MNHLALITKTQSLIAAGDIAGAESALTELADTEGDSALMVVLDQLEPKDILAVMREYDPSRESVVSLLVTPAQFAHAIVIEKRYKDLTHTHLRGMVNAIVFREDADPVAFLTAVGDLEGGSEAMANYFAEKWARIESFARSGNFDTDEEDGEMMSESELLASAYLNPRVHLDEVADQDWMELAWRMRYECPDLFTETLLVLRAQARAHNLGVGNEEEEADDEDTRVETRDTDRGHGTPAARDDEEESAI
ncbi:hypothetical protein H7F36_01980 [Variovorax sp. PAMC28562]|uniref:hypothetical protein n=1 Tax=Variovorax sp. PAMC28562 TaxID=2762323 RepID=UPI00164E64E3|nr:hypothetical protein [Variovorax sp. PAMC28562]QNK74057.1 hypothetical protein H7F36_01980 [Variovorax sp. PAMC28562]